jgi:hypothetical protein
MEYLVHIFLFMSFLLFLEPDELFAWSWDEFEQLDFLPFKFQEILGLLNKSAIVM